MQCSRSQWQLRNMITLSCIVSRITAAAGGAVTHQVHSTSKAPCLVTSAGTRLTPTNTRAHATAIRVHGGGADERRAHTKVIDKPTGTNWTPLAVRRRETCAGNVNEHDVPWVAIVAIDDYCCRSSRQSVSPSRRRGEELLPE